ncbi:MAG: asparaginase [Cyclobacteriaceae bacterium]|nr:asparaginase [Cyclobacteriaceae bacterium]MCH8516681.1 asparaginase [Cyclobacteriaceae bacterium]
MDKKIYVPTEKVSIDCSSSQYPLAKILVIYTGGTLGMVHDDKGVLVPFDFEEILDKIPSMRYLSIEIDVVSFTKPLDSSDVGVRQWRTMARLIFDDYAFYDGFVILHGTDTMAYSASMLSFMLQGLRKPVIFTGAQLPVSAPRSDARINLISALEIAAAKDKDGNSIVTEVAIYFNNRLLRGNRAKKVESVQFDAFESSNYPLLAESGLQIRYNRSVIDRFGTGLSLYEDLSDAIAVIKIFPGIRFSWLEHILSDDQMEGVILETFGSGNAPTHNQFIKIISDSVKSGKTIMNVSQCDGGKVDQSSYAAGKGLEEIGVLSGDDINTEAAVAKMMHVLGQNYTCQDREKILSEPLVGEMSYRSFFKN